MTSLLNTYSRFRNFLSGGVALPYLAGVVLIPLFLWLLFMQPVIIAPAVLAGLCLFILLVRYPEYGLYLLILSVAGQDKTAVNFGSQRITATQVLVLVTIAAWFANRIYTRKSFFNSPPPPLLKWFLLYLGTMVLSMTVATSTNASLDQISRWLITIFAYVYATSVIETRRQFWQLVVVLSLGGVLEAGLGVVQTGLGIGPESFAISNDLTRAYGTFPFPNPFAGYLEMCLPLLVALALLGWKLRNEGMKAWLAKEGQPRQDERKKIIRAYLILALTLPPIFLVGLGIIASYSRGSWLGLMVAGGIMIAVRGYKSTWLAIGIIALGIFGYLGLSTGAISPSIASRLSSIADQFTPFDVRDVVANDENYAVVERMAMWQAGGNMFLHDPWLGIGIGNFDTVYDQFNAPDWIYSRGHAHNYYIHAAAETGIFGLTAYMCLVLALFTGAWRTVRHTQDQYLRYVAWGGLGIVTSIMFHNIVENLHVLNLGIQWCGILALFYLIPKLDNPRQAETKKNASVK